MKRKKLQKVVSVLLCLLMLLAVAACGKTEDGKTQEGTSKEASSKETDSASAEKGNQEVTELNVFFPDSSNGGSTENVPWFDNYIAENLGIVLRSRPMADGILQSMIASGEIPDIVTLHPDTYKAALDAGLLLDLSQYKEQLPAIFENELYDSMVEAQTDENGSMYGSRIAVGTDSTLFKYGSIRWDVYAKIGYPEINTMDDLLDVAKQMQDACPTTPEGEPNYAFIMFSDWDGATPFLLANYYYTLLGYEEAYCQVCTIKSDGSEDPQAMLDDGSVYYDALKFMFKANQMGLLDPDSPTLTWEEAGARYNNGQALIAPWDWFRVYNKLGNNYEDGIGYTPFLANAFTYAVNSDSVVGSSNGWCYGISANAENLDAALKYLNWSYSYEGMMVQTMGPEGVLWKYDESGSRVLTEGGEKARKEGTIGTYEMPGGGTIGDLSATNSFSGGSMTNETVYPGDGKPVNLSYAYKTIQEGKLFEDWYRVNGEFDIGDYPKVWDGKTGNKVVKRSVAFGYTPDFSDEAKELLGAIKPVMNTASWKMIFAKDEAEFDTLWKQMQKDCKELGIDQVVEEVKEIWKTSKELAGIQ